MMSEEHAQDKIAALEEELAKLRNEIAGLVEARARESHKPEAENAESGSAAGKFERELGAAVKAGKRALHELDASATRYPVGSVVVAFTVGLVLARLFGGGRNKQ
jgi:ElaB/YqjD/DUF883 family membrane-anchored ribosome-binding protein